MSDAVARRSTRQLVGRRLGPEPYYTLTERTAARFVLESQPQINRRGGYRVLALGGVLLVLALLFMCAGYISVSQADGGFGSLAVTALIGGLLGGLGVVRLVGGVAIASTRNSIIVDAEARTIVYTQRNRVARPRTQTLGFEQIKGLRLTPRRLITSGILSRMYAIVVLELLTDGAAVWVVDSAAQAEALAPVMSAFSEVLGLPVEQGVAAAGVVKV